MRKQPDNITGYDSYYRVANYFHYREWLYRPYIKAVVKRAKLSTGSRVLDAGCGQGFFTWLFGEEGMDVVGVDTSAQGIRSAQQQYNSTKVRFEIGDILLLPFRGEFDCVFTRSCSLYNVASLEESHYVTEALLSYLRPHGILIVDYYSRLGGAGGSTTWIYHSLEGMKRHVSQYRGSRVYFSTRLDTMLIGRFAFTQPVTFLNSALSRLIGVGGELVAFIGATDSRKC